MVSATDNVDPNPIITQDPPVGSPFNDGMLITFTASDTSGNQSFCSFRVRTPIINLDAGSDVTIDEGEQVQLNAIASTTGTFQWTPSNGLNSSTLGNPIANPVETTTYLVSFTSDEGCTVEDLITIFVNPLPDDETKYGFSPDGDGINEFWEIDGIENYPNNDVQIYNRWGDLVFEIHNYNNTSNVFRGEANRKTTIGGGDLPEGTYFFKIHINEVNNLRTEGFVVLKR